MKLVNFYRKPISLFVMVAFTIMLCFWANQASAAEKNSETTLEQRESGSPNFIEQENEAAATVRKPHKFPWFLVGSVVVVGAAAIYYFLVLNKKYTLTVTLDPGTTGTPAATAKFKKGSAIPYNYTPQAGYGSLQVKLDGVAVAASGTVNMDKDHTLDVSASQEYTLTINLGIGTTGTPAATAKYKNGQVVNYNYSAQAGYSYLQVKLDDVAVLPSGTVIMNRDHTLDVQATPINVKRVVVAEEFTGTWCQYCPGAAMGLDQLKKENPATLAVIAYHGSDSFAYADIYNARKSFYGVSGIPDVFFDGLESVSGGSASETQYPRYKAAYDRRAGIPPQVKYRLLAQGGNTINTEISNVSGQTLTGTFHFLIVEDNIPFPWLNQSILRFVCRAMLPNANGEAITLASGQMKTMSRTYTISNGWNRTNCHIVVFVQGSNKEISQGIEADLPSN